MWGDLRAGSVCHDVSHHLHQDGDSDGDIVAVKIVQFRRLPFLRVGNRARCDKLEHNESWQLISSGRTAVGFVGMSRVSAE
jgi:hypothetical protein